MKFRFFKFFCVLSSLLLVILACSHLPPNPCHQKLKTHPTPYTGESLDFYSTKNPYGEFSNFAEFPVFLDNEWWATSEHYYQAQKYDSAELKKWVQSATTPQEAANRGRSVQFSKRKDWEEIKESVMEKAVRDKFYRHSCLRELLVSTGSSRLYEHTKNDCFWGDCGDRTGKNKLGLLLEKIRGQFKGENHP